MDEATGEVTLLVERWSHGDAGALDQLIAVAYDDLRHIARRQLRSWGSGQTIETTALVHELYLRLAGVEEGTWGGRAQFFAFCAKAMRRILIDFARRRSAAKRGGDLVRAAQEPDSAALDTANEELLALDEALTTLAARHARMAEVVECRFFGGLSVVETAEALRTSPRTVEREWARARAYLQLALADDPAHPVLQEGP
jgi:RNA polymerase sigma-70 factor, ECF subfamily